jgi:glycosyltransferase involved in cell wall biosynthesis
MPNSVGILVDRLTVGGVEKTAIQEVRHLNDLGHNSILLVLRRGTAPEAYTEILSHIPLIYLDDRLPKVFRSSFSLPFFAFFSLFHLTYPVLIPFVVRNDEFRVIISHNSYTTFTAWSLSVFKGIPYVMFIWDPVRYIVEKAYPRGPIKWALWILEPLARLIDSILLARAKSAVVGSPRHEPYLDQINHRRKEVFRAPPGARFTDQIPERRMDYLLSATAWKSGKQLETLLDVIADVPAARLTVAGAWVDESYRKVIEDRIASLNIGTRVRVLGTVTEARLSELYRGARLSITPNAELGFGMPTLEAIANGSPIACPRSSGVAAYFDADEAFFFDEGDRHAIQEIVERVIEDERLAYGVGHRAWQKAREIHTWEVHTLVLLRATQGL